MECIWIAEALKISKCFWEPRQIVSVETVFFIAGKEE
jgi:hypothetical protein